MGDLVPHLIHGRRGGKCLVFCGYLYHKRSEYNGTTYWKCVERKRCNARAQTENMSLRIIRSSAHNHEPCQECVQSRRSDSNFKWRHRGRIPHSSKARYVDNMMVNFTGIVTLIF